MLVASQSSCFHSAILAAPEPMENSRRAGLPATSHLVQVQVQVQVQDLPARMDQPLARQTARARPRAEQGAGSWASTWGGAREGWEGLGKLHVPSNPKGSLIEGSPLAGGWV